MNANSPVTDEEFRQYIEALGPWGQDSFDHAPVAIAVSGGADSLCLALLASRWRKNVLALIVDHQLRPESAAEARLTQQRLSDLSIPSQILTLHGFASGTALEERARIERYRILIDCCYRLGVVDLLLGHHAGDQAETVLMRIRAGSGSDGLAGIAQIMELPQIRLIRPLLSVHPQRLRQTLRARKIGWVEDPSNQDMSIQRNSLRKELSHQWEQSGTVSMLLLRSQQEGEKRMERDVEQALHLMDAVEIRPEGFAFIHGDEMDERGLGALIRTVSGSVYAPLRKSLEKLAKNIRTVTLGGVQIISAGRLGQGWLMIREVSVMETPVKALPNILWDSRFKVMIPDGNFQSRDFPDTVMVGALGDAYGRFSDRKGLPASILRTLPAFWSGTELLAVPHLGICLEKKIKNWNIIFQPKQPVIQTCLFAGVKMRDSLEDMKKIKEEYMVSA